MNSNFLEIKNATFVASEKNKINDVSLTIKEKGEIVCLLGPSGVGKTTILRTIAGLQELKSGQINLKGKTISSENFNLEPEKRNIAMCFQDNSLFPHFNVTENINIGAKRKNGSKFNYSDKDLIKILHLEGVQEKYPHQISSGEAQRVSLARSLLSRPDLLLLDEPFANIDTSLKEELQKKIKDILKEFNITTIIVTHDSYEAFFMGDKCGILLDQSLKQYDEPYNIHHEPNSLEVAKFLNRGVFVDVKVVETDCAVHSLSHPTLGEIRGKLVNNFPVGTTVKLLLQPEDLRHDDQSKLKLEVIDRKFRGTNFIYTLKTSSDEKIPVFVHSHHIHQHEKSEKFGIKTPIFIDHLVCF